MFSIPIFLGSFEPLLWAARFTVLISFLGIAVGLLIGALICAAALSRVVWLRRFAALWVSFLRGVPLLVQLLLAYYLLPVIGINVPAMVAAVVTVGICSSAYVSEIWRGAIMALPKGQAEAATAIGMAPRDIWSRIILPQAISMSLPALINE
jgi:polar amino acid transport system permease protein